MMTQMHPEKVFLQRTAAATRLEAMLLRHVFLSQTKDALCWQALERQFERVVRVLALPSGIE